MKLLLIFLISISSKIIGQNASLAKAESSNNSYDYNVRFSLYSIFKGGTTLSIGIGTWAKFNYIQPATNISLNAVLGRNNIGNRNRPGKGNDHQFNLIFSPLITIGKSKNTAISEYINTFYLGNSGAVMSNHKRAFTIGTNFITLPRGARYNSSTSRNRTQQLIFLQAKWGFDYNKNVILNFYDDFAGISNFGLLKGFADNFDRFYTGGGNLQIRVNEKLAFKTYFEIYTGTFHKDLFDFPDLITTKSHPVYKRLIRVTSHESGQKLFNKGRSIFNISYVPDNSNTEYNIYLGSQDGQCNMGFQNLFHDLTKIMRPIENDTTRLYRKKLINGDNKKLASLHRFYPNIENSHFILGVGTNINFQ